MGSVLGVGLLVVAAGFYAYRAGRIFADAGRYGFPPRERLGWALLGAAVPSRYWWGGRLAALSPDQQTELLWRETQAMGVTSPGNLRCPLCGAEVFDAWALGPNGHANVAPGPVECPHCDFRLDACRHCTHFLPGDPTAQSTGAWASGDLTLGRCDQYKTYLPVERVCQPQIARQLKARGWERVRSPRPVIDSFVPLDCCRSYAADRKRLKAGRVRWPDARRTALLRLLAPPPIPPGDISCASPSDDEQWLF